jgi:RNA polymerase sigma-70 factor, ECF subfamily
LNQIAGRRALCLDDAQPQGNAKMSAATDEELLKRIVAGDNLAMKSFYARHHVRLYRFLVRMTRREATAEELMHEVLLEIWRKAGSYEGRSSVSTWMLSIAHHKAISQLRKRSEQPLDEDETATEMPDDEDDPEVALQKRNKSTVMRACMEKLSEEHRTILDLVYYHDRSVADASEVLGIPENTVKTRLFYARKRLAVLMSEAGLDRGWP